MIFTDTFKCVSIVTHVIINQMQLNTKLLIVQILEIKLVAHQPIDTVKNVKWRLNTIFIKMITANSLCYGNVAVVTKSSPLCGIRFEGERFIL